MEDKRKIDNAIKESFSSTIHYRRMLLHQRIASHHVGLSDRGSGVDLRARGHPGELAAIECSGIMLTDRAGTVSTQRDLVTGGVVARVRWCNILSRHRFLVFTSQSPLTS